MNNMKWTYKEHTESLADTGDYNSYVEFTNGKDIWISNDYEMETEDLQKMGGMEALDEPYMSMSIFGILKKRAGWLIVLFLGETLTASAMSFFENEIAKAVVLAMFIPLIISHS